MVLGTNPILANRTRYQKRRAEKGSCGFKWPSKWNEEDHPYHVCTKFKNHISRHKCNCNATIKVREDDGNSVGIGSFGERNNGL